MRLRIATAEGLVESPGGVTRTGPVRVFGDALVENGRHLLWRGPSGWYRVADTPGILCAVDAPGGLIVGTEAGHLRRLGTDGLELVDGFEQVPGREEWYTPWGGPPEVRSVGCTPDNILLVNVHVGGILRSDDGGRNWAPTVDLHDDVHQVRPVLGRPDLVLAAAAVGLLVSDDSGLTWRTHSRGLHATYCRAVAASDEAILVSASEGPRGRRSAIYRTDIRAREPFDRVTDWIDGNVDSHALDALGEDAAFGTPTGDVYESADAGAGWKRTLRDLAPITSLSIVA